MASFCSKCGSELSADTKFCGSCGTPAGFTAPAAAPPVATVASVAPAPSPTPAAPSTGGLKIVLIIIAVIVGLGVMGAAAVMFGIWRISKSVDVDRNGGVTISTPQGKITAGKTAHVTEAEVGAPIYPGSIAAEGGFKLGSESGSMATYVFTTSDSVQQVLDFYRDKFGPKTSVIESPQGAMVTGSKGDNEGIMVTIGRDESEGKTSITITHGTSLKNHP
jgi:hypothetical protein